LTLKGKSAADRLTSKAARRESKGVVLQEGRRNPGKKAEKTIERNPEERTVKMPQERGGGRRSTSKRPTFKDQAPGIERPQHWH